MFNPDKSKFLVTASRKPVFIKICALVVFFIGGKPVENVSQYSHLGHIINSSISDSDDITNRRNCFVGQANNVMCFFNKLDLTVIA